MDLSFIEHVLSMCRGVVRLSSCSSIDWFRGDEQKKFSMRIAIDPIAKRSWDSPAVVALVVVAPLLHLGVCVLARSRPVPRSLAEVCLMNE